MNYALPIFAVLLSFAFVYVVKPDNKSHFKLLLAFSGAFLLALTIFELLPEVYEDHSGKHIGIYIMLGILLQIFLEFFSKGAEHGHVHLSNSNTNFPWLLLGSLSLHALLEGVPLSENNSLIYGILVHKIAIAIILSIFLMGSKLKLNTSIIFILLFSVMTPLGTYLSQSMNFIMDNLVFINAMVIGVLLHISTIILFESSEGHKFNLRKLTVILFGIIIAYFL